MPTIETQDVMPVRSRVSWGAILAGAVVALAVYVLLGALGLAIGLTVRTELPDRTVGLNIGAGIWAVVTTLFALFLGGFVTSQCTVGETKQEAALYGLMVWGAVFAMLFWMGNNVSFSLNAIMGMTNTAVNVDPARLPSVQMTQEAAWWTFGGLGLSMLAAVVGSIAGAGPEMLMSTFRFRSTTLSEPASR